MSTSIRADVDLAVDLGSPATVGWGAYAPPAVNRDVDDGWQLTDEYLLLNGLPCAVGFSDDELEGVLDRQADVHTLAVANIDRQRLRRALAGMPALDRLVMYLLVGLGCSRHRRTEVAELLELSEAQVSDVEQRAVEALRASGVAVAV